MITILKVNGNIRKIRTEPNDRGCGTNIYITEGTGEKYGYSKYSEQEYHKRIRINAIKNGDIILDGDLVWYCGKYDINTFKNGKRKS